MFTRRENYNTGSHPLIGMIIFLFLATFVMVGIASTVLFCAENPGLLIAAFGAFLIYLSCGVNDGDMGIDLMAKLGMFFGLLVAGVGSFVIYNNGGITFQYFINMFV